jgi:hypothetical protein
MRKMAFAFTALVLYLSFSTPAFAARHKVPVFHNKETTVDMSKMNRIFIGWVDMHEDDWGAHGYQTKQDWVNIIASLNASFSSNLIASDLTGRTLVSAKDKGDENAKDCDLYVKFTDVHVDYDNYHLILAIHFIDPKTGKEIGSIPVRPYYGNDWGLRGYLNEALKQVGQKLQVEIAGASQK